MEDNLLEETLSFELFHGFIATMVLDSRRGGVSDLPCSGTKINS